jgi:3-oxoacyl-[acyl-carrier-protein] synthase-3
MTKKKTIIRSLGTYIPQKILSNFDLEKMVDTTDEWIITRTGIQERRIAVEHESASFMGKEAALQAIQKANISPESIDLIIASTMSPDYFCPSTSTLIQGAIGATQAAAFDIAAACSGYIYGLSIASAYIESGLAKTILLVSTEKNSAFVDYKDRNTCVLFGDGAGASIITSSGPGLIVKSLDIGSDGSEGHLIQIPAGGSKLPSSHETVEQGLHYIKMNGREVFKHAVRRMETSAKACLEKAHIEEKEIRWLVPHQANMRIIEALEKRFAIPHDHVTITIDKHANTSSSTIPIALNVLLEGGKVAPKDLILLTAFGGGLTWGSAILEATE